MRDARPFLQIAHVGPWNVAVPEALALARAQLFRESKRNVDEIDRHDPTAVLALRQWLEAVALRDAVGRKLPTWLIETGSRTSMGDDPSFAYARTLARALAHGAQQARALCPGAHDVRGALDAAGSDARSIRMGAALPAPPLCMRAPHGAFEVQLYAQDSEGVARDVARARLAALLDEHAPHDRAPVLLLTAGFDHTRALDAMPIDARESAFALSSRGHEHSVTASTSRAHPEKSASNGEQRVALLRVYASASHRKSALIERLLFARPLAMGPFRLLSSQSFERLISWP